MNIFSVLMTWIMIMPGPGISTEFARETLTIESHVTGVAARHVTAQGSFMRIYMVNNESCATGSIQLVELYEDGEFYSRELRERDGQHVDDVIATALCMIYEGS